ncbi:DegT/DnrJ/EryC1/StrS family aminotransferase [Marinivivus vitaminiproducens]|uniref:DegT/DnrJ/EryC1/StrS family aminotransferase n=1 Tax=Marinivivus vitaminiproducens TaxID=3035935 RepID=UPI003FA15778
MPFIDLARQRAGICERLDAAIARVLHHGHFIMGPEVDELEERLGLFCGARHVITCANGTDALALALMALRVRTGDAVFVPSFTFAATAEIVPSLGATPVFVDVREDTFTLDPASLERGVAAARRHGLRPAGIIAVDLFGQPAGYDALGPLADAYGMWLVADAAQSFGARLHGRPVGQYGRITTTSFFPAKPLGCFGDGGAVFTDDDRLADVMRSLRVHGKGTDKYDNVRIGMNSRLDTLQAAILLEKLRIFPDEIVARDAVADRYRAGLADLVQAPALAEGATSVWAQYTVRAGDRRDALARDLKAAGVPTAIYYATPLHHQTAYAGFPLADGGLPVSERLAREVLSLPMHPYLEAPVQARIVDAVRHSLARGEEMASLSCAI